MQIVSVQHDKRHKMSQKNVNYASVLLILLSFFQNIHKEIHLICELAYLQLNLFSEVSLFFISRKCNTIKISFSQLSKVVLFLSFPNSRPIISLFLHKNSRNFMTLRSFNTHTHLTSFSAFTDFSFPLFFGIEAPEHGAINIFVHRTVLGPLTPNKGSENSHLIDYSSTSNTYKNQIYNIFTKAGAEKQINTHPNKISSGALNARNHRGRSIIRWNNTFVFAKNAMPAEMEPQVFFF